MSQIVHTDNPSKFVEENRELITHILMHGDDEFVRAGMLAMLVRYGSDPDIDQVRRELDLAREVLG